VPASLPVISKEPAGIAIRVAERELRERLGPQVERARLTGPARRTPVVHRATSESGEKARSCTGPPQQGLTLAKTALAWREVVEQRDERGEDGGGACGVAVGETSVEHVGQRADEPRRLGFRAFDATDQVAAAQHRALGDRRLPGGQHPDTGACTEHLAVPFDVIRREILVRFGRAWQLRAAARLDAVGGGGAEFGERL
jgi:hypothetical protein